MKVGRWIILKFAQLNINEIKISIFITGNMLDLPDNNQTTNQLDQNGMLIWEETGETAPEYEIRYLQEDGTIISESEYNIKSEMGENVFIAAFIGCTYHCG